MARSVLLVGHSRLDLHRLLFTGAETHVETSRLEETTAAAVTAGALVVIFDAAEVAPCGMDLLRALKTSSDHATTDVVYCGDGTTRDAALATGAACFLEYPFSLAEFRAEAFALLGLRMRRAPRIHFDKPATLTSGDAAAEARFVDLSPCGAFVGGRVFPLGSNVKVDFDPGDGEPPLSLWAAVRMCGERHVAGETVHGIGVEFLDVPAEVTDRLWRIVTDVLVDEVNSHAVAQQLSIPVSFAFASTQTNLAALRSPPTPETAERHQIVQPHEWEAIRGTELDPSDPQAWLAIAAAVRGMLHYANAHTKWPPDIENAIVEASTYLRDLGEFLLLTANRMSATHTQQFEESQLLLLRELIRLRDYYNEVKAPEDPDFYPQLRRAEDYFRGDLTTWVRYRRHAKKRAATKGQAPALSTWRPGLAYVGLAAALGLGFLAVRELIDYRGNPGGGSSARVVRVSRAPADSAFPFTRSYQLDGRVRAIVEDVHWLSLPGEEQQRRVADYLATLPADITAVHVYGPGGRGVVGVTR